MKAKDDEAVDLRVAQSALTNAEALEEALDKLRKDGENERQIQEKWGQIQERWGK